MVSFCSLLVPSEKITEGIASVARGRTKFRGMVSNPIDARADHVLQRTIGIIRQYL
ncbi:MAG: hypothetical protein ACTSRK_14225 [Promethearchaeota archaeon]